MRIPIASSRSQNGLPPSLIWLTLASSPVCATPSLARATYCLPPFPPSAFAQRIRMMREKQLLPALDPTTELLSKPRTNHALTHTVRSVSTHDITSSTAPVEYLRRYPFSYRPTLVLFILTNSRYTNLTTSSKSTFRETAPVRYFLPSPALAETRFFAAYPTRYIIL